MAENQPAFGRGRTGGNRRASEARGFWHRPEWMNLTSDVLLLAGSIALGYALVRSALAMPVFGFREVVVISPLSQVTTAQLEYAAQSGLRGNFFSVRLDEARSAFEKLPWVRRAEVRRVWPGTLEVKLEEHVATAYWRTTESGDMRLVNQYGEVFAAASNANMPMFSGPEGRAAEVLTRYKEFSERVAPLKLQVSAVALSTRDAWQLKLSDGMVLDLGRDETKQPVGERLSRFTEVWPAARTHLAQPVKLADLRYPSGFAVRTNVETPNPKSPPKGKQ